MSWKDRFTHSKFRVGRFTPGMSNMTIKIILADDHQIVRQGLRTLLSGEPDMEVVGEADNGRKTLQLARNCPRM